MDRFGSFEMSLLTSAATMGGWLLIGSSNEKEAPPFEALEPAFYTEGNNRGIFCGLPTGCASLVVAIATVINLLNARCAILERSCAITAQAMRESISGSTMLTSHTRDK